MSEEAIIPNLKESIASGGIVPLGPLRNNRKFETVRAIARKHGFSLYDPLEEIPQDVISLLIYGSDDLYRIGDGNDMQMTAWEGVVGDVEDRIVCPVCHGTRLKEETACFRIDGKTITEVSAMEISELLAWVRSLDGKLSGRGKAVARDVLRELSDRLQFLVDVGLEYLSLDRATASLSGGESQRIRLATQIGSKLVGVIYILDEPSIGLHQRDNRKLISSLKKLRDEGNTVIVVEHDEETMRAADWLVDVGPGAGELGGRICYSGPGATATGVASEDRGRPWPREWEGSAPSGVGGMSEAKSCGGNTSEVQPGPSTTLQYLSGHRKIEVPKERRKGNGKTLILRGAAGNNLRNIDVSFPLGCLVGIAARALW